MIRLQPVDVLQYNRMQSDDLIPLASTEENQQTNCSHHVRRLVLKRPSGAGFQSPIDSSHLSYVSEELIQIGEYLVKFDLRRRLLVS